jgi:hypothetical protein
VGDTTPLELFGNAVREMQTQKVSLMKRVQGEDGNLIAL